MINLFDLFKKKAYEGDIVDLKERYRVSEATAYDGVPTVYYDILKHDDKEKVGSIDLRFTIEGDMYYYGHVGYNVLRRFRGHGYAYEACKVLFRIARKEFGMEELIITCSPENIASYKTLVKLGGEMIEQVDVPPNHRLYMLGEKTKCIFRYKI
ncbi:MAG: GNAT family N-acetyltransferase [Erysipelotrichaceae bacterium]|nr:GNAT family N-acetyltransferase [Erysipelotrichaceae bacterium]